MQLPQDIVSIYNKFSSVKRKLYIVGGGVRDYIMKLTPKDFDMATDANPDEIIQILQGYELDFTGKSFGVIRVYTKNAPKGYEIATFRKDITVGRNPKVQVGVTIEEDVNRRDLTINALFFDIETQSIVDYVGGMNDINNKIIRTPGIASHRFNEDKLRILRTIRFAARFGFDIDNNTWDAIRNDNKLVGPDENGNLVPLSQERIVEEFIKGIEQCGNVCYYLQLLNDADILSQMFPKLTVTYSKINVRALEIIIATLIKDTSNINTKILHTLIYDCKFPIKVANGVEFLLNLYKLTSDNAYSFKRNMVKTNLTSFNLIQYAILNQLDLKTVKVFSQYEITTTGNNLINEGFKQGEELGKELQRREKENFNQLLVNFKGDLINQ